MPTILIADDNSNIQKMVALAFKNEGIDVVAVGNGEAAIRKAVEIMPNLVLADIFMPVRNGYEVCETLKQDSRSAEIPVVLLVGAFDPFDEKEAQRVGADGVLKKPFVPPDPLIGLVKSLLAKTMPVELVPVPGAIVEPSAVAVGYPPIFQPPQKRVETPVADEYPEVEEIAPAEDFSLQPAEIVSHSEGGADAFGSMLDTSPIGTMRPSLGPTVEKVHAQEHSAATTDVAAWPGSTSTAEQLPANTEQKTSAEDSAQFPPLREQDIRHWEEDEPAVDGSQEDTLVEPAGRFPSLSFLDHYKNNSHEAVKIQIGSPDESDSPEAAESTAGDWRTPSLGLVGWDPEAPVTSEPPLSQEKSFAPSSVAAKSEDRADRQISTAEPAEDKFAASLPVEVNSSIAPNTTVEAELSPVAGTAAGSDLSPDDQTPSTRPSASGDVKSLELPAASVPSWLSFTSPFTGAGSKDTRSPEDTDVQSISQPTATTKTEIETEPTAAAPTAPAHAAALTDDSGWIGVHAAEASPDVALLSESALSELLPSATVQFQAEASSVPEQPSTDPRAIEEIVTRVVERMQPQILDMITREVLRPVVEALVRRQIEQK